MFASLGDIQFELLPCEGLSSTNTYDYAEHKTIESKPKLQYLGDGLETHEIKLKFHADFCIPDDEYASLKEVASKHEAMSLVFANGEYKGEFVIEEITGDYKQSFGDGTTMFIEVTLKIKEWVEDTTLTTKTSTKTTTTSTSKKKDTGTTTATETNKDSVSMDKIVGQG